MRFHNAVLILIVAALFGAWGMAFGQVELTPTVGFEFTSHNGFGDHFRGLSIGMDLGGEIVYAPHNNFGIGLQGKTGLAYDAYMIDSEHTHRETIVDEYIPWTFFAGPIFYIGNSWFVSGSVGQVINIIHHDTYLSTEETNEDLSDRPYRTGHWKYMIETGWRTSFHWAISAKVMTNLIDSYTIHRSKWNIYLGFRYFI